MNYKQFDICIILNNGHPFTLVYFIDTPEQHKIPQYYCYPYMPATPLLHNCLFVNNLPHLNYSDAKLLLKQIYDNLPKSHPELFL